MYIIFKILLLKYEKAIHATIAGSLKGAVF